LDRDTDGKDLIQSVVRECRWGKAASNFGLTGPAIGTSLAKAAYSMLPFFFVFLDLRPHYPSRKISKSSQIEGVKMAADGSHLCKVMLPPIVVDFSFPEALSIARDQLRRLCAVSPA
jgi:hypothetical protein